MADVSKVNVNSTDYNIKDSNAMHKGVDRVTAGQSIIAPIGTASTADGFAVNASGDYSHASGFHTIAASDVQHVIGKYNEEDANGTYPFIIGGGRLDTDRKNIFTVDWNGDVNAGRSNGLTNDTKLPTGADVVSYLNSNLAWKGLGTITDVGTFTLTQDISNFKEIHFLLVYGGGARNSLILPIGYFINNAGFPDFTIGQNRIYLGYTYVNSTTINVTVFEKAGLNNVSMQLFGR